MTLDQLIFAEHAAEKARCGLVNAQEALRRATDAYHVADGAVKRAREQMFAERTYKVPN
jgi:hypothetical protein